MLLQVVHLGVVPYREALELQRALVERRKAGAVADTLLLLEHPAVITLGRNARVENVIASAAALAERGTEVIECDRGGDVTYHGPGQLVGYPIFDLRGFTDANGARRTMWPVEFVRNLEEALIGACGELGAPSARIAGLTGVWTAGPETAVQSADGTGPDRSESARFGQCKLAAIGVHISRGVTSHGFALNVNTDLSGFDAIVPCGIRDKGVTSLQRELREHGRLRGESVDMDLVVTAVTESFARVFHKKTRWLSGVEEILPQEIKELRLRIPRELRRVRAVAEKNRA